MPVLSIVSTSVCKKNYFIQLHCLKALFRLLLIILFYSKLQNIFSRMNDLLQAIIEIIFWTTVAMSWVFYMYSTPKLGEFFHYKIQNKNIILLGIFKTKYWVLLHLGFSDINLCGLNSMTADLRVRVQQLSKPQDFVANPSLKVSLTNNNNKHFI